MKPNQDFVFITDSSHSRLSQPLQQTLNLSLILQRTLTAHTSSSPTKTCNSQKLSWRLTLIKQGDETEIQDQNVSTKVKNNVNSSQCRFTTTTSSPEKNRQRSRYPPWRSPPVNKTPPRHCLVCRNDLTDDCPTCEDSLVINAEGINLCQAVQCQECGYMFHDHCIDARTVQRIQDCPMQAVSVHQFIHKKQRDGEGMDQFVVDDWQIDPSILSAEVSKNNEVSKFK